jgi:hypothetical protein
MTHPRPTSDRLRVEIDQGRGADKVNWPDPAAAPLGTDDEAGGATPTPRQVSQAHRLEIMSRDDDPSRDRGDRRMFAAGRTALFWGVAGGMALIALLLIGVMTSP